VLLMVVKPMTKQMMAALSQTPALALRARRRRR
jgi:hypothetical protein